MKSIMLMESCAMSDLDTKRLICTAPGGVVDYFCLDTVSTDFAICFDREERN